MLKKLFNAIHNEDGQGLAEYGLILSLIVMAAVATLTQVGTSINNTFTSVTAAL